MTQYNALVPLGEIAITAAGSPTPLSVNCGPYGGQTGTYPNAPVPGNAWRGFELQSAVGNGGKIYLLPRGKTAVANPEAILAIIGPGGSLTFPMSSMSGVGVLPENFVVDTDAVSGTQYVYGYGTLG
jgi:hypothetical protein